jgi:hypothetical protein
LFENKKHIVTERIYVAKARQRTYKVDKVDYYGLASIRSVKTISQDKEIERKKNKEKHRP